MSDTPHFRIGTRGSDLAMWQAHYVRDLIEQHGGTCEIHVLSTQGDREQVQAFEKLEGKGFFTKEIELALLTNDIDLAVHSHKDLETQQPEGLCIAAVPTRASAEDILLVHPRAHRSATWLPLKEGGAVGTSSVRRRDQLLLLRPDLSVQALRGNVPTRIQHLKDGRYDAIVLAAAGIERLNLDLGDLRVHKLDPRQFVPAPAQGALALQMRTSDPRKPWLTQLQSSTTAQTIENERSILRALEGGCQLPFGAHHPAPNRPLRCFLQTKTGPRRILASNSKEALQKLNKTEPRRLLITRIPKPHDTLHRLAKGNGDTLLEWPAAIPVPIENPEIPNTAMDWVWLGSPGAVRACSDWLHEHPNVKIATPGPGTSEALDFEDRGRLEFCGNGDPTGAWRSFLDTCCTGESVAIPHSQQSLKRWETFTASASLHPWVHYAAEPNTGFAPACDAVCFTSPTNVRLWSGPQPPKIVAIGPTTSAELNARSWDHTVAIHPDAFGIWEAYQGS